MPLYKLTDQQVNTVRTALRLDWKSTRETFGALPIGEEMLEEIETAYAALSPNRVLKLTDEEMKRYAPDGWVVLKA